MRSIPSISNLINKRTGILISCLTGYIFAHIILDYSFGMAMMIVIGILMMLLFITFPKFFIFFYISTYPFQPLVWGLAGFRPGGSSYFSINMGGLIFVFCFLYGALFLLRERPRIFEYKLTVPLILFLSLLLLNAFRSPYTFEGIRDVVRYSAAASLYYLVVVNFNTREARYLLKLSLVIFVGIILYGNWLLIFHGGRTEAMPIQTIMATSIADNRLSGGGVIHPSTFGQLLTTFIFISIFFMFEGGKVRYIWINLIYILNMLVLLFTTYSRGSWLSLVGGGAVLGMLRNRRYFALALIIGILVLASVPSITDKIVTRVTEEGTIKVRYKIWQYGFDLFMQNPIIGHGFGAMKIAQEKEQGLAERLYSKQSKSHSIGGMSAHNEYLKVISAGGLVGLGIYLYLLFKGVQLSFELLKSPNKSAKNYGAVFMAITVQVALNGVGDHGFQYLVWHYFPFYGVGEVFLRDLNADTLPEPAL